MGKSFLKFHKKIRPKSEPKLGENKKSKLKIDKNKIEENKMNKEQILVLEEELKRFQSEFTKVFYFTYRNSFSPILPSNLTSDLGWGCMLRTGQMMIAEAFRRHFVENGNYKDGENNVHKIVREKKKI